MSNQNLIDVNNSTMQGSDSQNTNNSFQDAKEKLKLVLQFSLTLDLISVMIAFAIRKQKLGFVANLNKIILEMQNSLTEEERKELQKETDTLISQKAEEMVKLVNKNMDPEDIAYVISELKKDFLSQETVLPEK